MRLHRFYIREPIGMRTEITVKSADVANQLRRVFRLKTGDPLTVFDGSGSDYLCRIEEIDKDTIRLAIVEAARSRFMPERKIVLCAATVKKDNFEWIVEKAVELGVTEIIPIVAERSEKKSLNIGRLAKIAIEASEQSGRGDVPKIGNITTLNEVISMTMLGSGAEPQMRTVAFHTEGKAFGRSEFEGTNPVTVFIGPEGGWSPSEIDMFHDNNIAVRCLGAQVLRTETAAIAALSQFVFF